MARKVTRQPVQAGKDERPTPGAVSTASVMSGAVAPLHDLAEELGRLLARRELARSNGRRGYSLPQILIGASVLAVLWILVARSLGLLPH